MIEKQHITQQNYAIDKHARNKQKGHNSFVIWLTGLSGSGKSTLANELEVELFNRNINGYTLDGDNLRGGLNKDLTFSETDREENIRRVAEVSKILMNAGTIVISAFISPFEKDRSMAKEIIGSDNFIEIYVECPIDICELRDVKGLYKKARNGEISNFTGISSPFETPANPNLVIHTNRDSIKQSSDKILAYILPKLVIHE